MEAKSTKARLSFKALSLKGKARLKAKSKARPKAKLTAKSKCMRVGLIFWGPKETLVTLTKTNSCPNNGSSRHVMN